MLEHSEIQVIHEELTNVIKTVTNVMEGLERRQTQDGADRRTKEVLQDRIVYLEGEVGRLQEENGWLKATNDELVAKLDDMKDRNRLQELEIEKLIDQRDNALDRLGKVEEMFKGIFHDKQLAMRAATPIREKRRESAGDGKDKGKQTEKRVSWSSTQVSSRGSTPSPSVRSGSTDGTITKVKSTSSCSSVQSSPNHARPSSSGGGRHEIRLSDPEESLEREWYIQTEKPPTTASSARGPFELGDLVERLKMNAGDVMRLEERVILSSQLGPRLHIHKDFIFFFDPMWLELAEHTCLIDWSEKEVHDNIKEYLRRKAKASAVFHIFSFPLHKNGWFYLGPHKLQLTDLLDVWPQLHQEEKQMYATTMKIRTQSGKTKRTEEEIIEMAESGKLTQTTIEVWKASFGDNVTTFVDKYGLAA